MAEVDLRIAPAVLRRHPELTVRAFEATGLEAASAGALAPSDADILRRLAEQDVVLASLSSHPAIATWRQAIGGCGLKPSRYRSSAEALARRWLNGDAVLSPVTLVNLYCAVSAFHLAPLGAFDLDRLPGEVVELRLGRPATDRFVPLGGAEGSMVVTERIVVYAAGSSVLTYAFNHRDSAETCLTTSSARALFLGEATTIEQDARLRAALADLRERLELAGAAVGPDMAGRPAAGG